MLVSSTCVVIGERAGAVPASGVQQFSAQAYIQVTLFALDRMHDGHYIS